MKDCDCFRMEDEYRYRLREMERIYERRLYEMAYGNQYRSPNWRWNNYFPYLNPSESIGYTIQYVNSITKEFSLPSPMPSKTYIIISSAGATCFPVAHKTPADAEKEANRLAKINPEQEFTVYETKKSFKVEDKPVTVKTFV